MIYVFAYLTTIVLANLTIAEFGPGATVVVALVFIGFDLVSRDRLHDRWGTGFSLVWKMAALIAAGGLISYVVNRAAGPIAVASCVAFAAAATTDAVVYWALRRSPYLQRVNGSNVPAAAVDSLLFPTLAFGAFLWPIVLGQFVAKVLGGFIWSVVLQPRREAVTD